MLSTSLRDQAVFNLCQQNGHNTSDLSREIVHPVLKRVFHQAKSLARNFTCTFFHRWSGNSSCLLLGSLGLNPSPSSSLVSRTDEAVAQCQSQEQSRSGGPAGSVGPSSTLSPPASFRGLKTSLTFHPSTPGPSILAAGLGANDSPSSGCICFARELASMPLTRASHGTVVRLTEMSGKLQPTLAPPGNGMGGSRKQGRGDIFIFKTLILFKNF